ncbi:hypothetical protein ACFDTO_33295 [Microbacteriaceae bacterium 4G12]
MKWLREQSVHIASDEPLILEAGDPDPHVHIQTVQLEGQTDNISVIAQLFIAPHLLYGEYCLTAIPITSKEMEERVEREIAIYFNKIQKIYVDRKIERFQFQKLKDTSRDQFQEMLQGNLIHSVVKELYFLAEKEPLENQISKQQVRYKVVKEYLPAPTTLDPDFLHAMHLIENTICKVEQSFALLPIGWKLKEELREFETLKVFSALFDSVFLTVNPETNQVLYMECNMNG